MSDSNAESVDLSALKIDKSKKSKVPGQRKKWLYFLWLPVMVLLYFAYQMTVNVVTPALKIQVARAQFLTGSEAQADLVATGYVVAQTKAAVASKGTGRLEVLNVEEGDKVKQGDVLATLDNNDIEANLDLARANLRASRADSIDTAISYNRQKELIKSGATTQDLVDVATARYERAMATMEVMRASVRSVQVALENTIIRAPFDGTVLSKDADVGEMVAPFASASSSRGAVVTLADMSSLEVEADVSESNIYKVKIGQPCEIVLDAYATIKYPGYVKKIVPTADRSRATVMTKIAFNTLDGKVLPEMSARVNFLLEKSKEESAQTTPVLTIPKGAITNRAAGKIVFKVSGAYVQEISVQTGRELGNVTEIISGLVSGDQVVLSPPGGMKSGDKIEVAN